MSGVPEETVVQEYLRIEKALGWLGFETKQGPNGRYLEYYKPTVVRDRALLEEIRTGLRAQPRQVSLEARVEELLAELDLPEANPTVMGSIGVGLATVRPRIEL